MKIALLSFDVEEFDMPFEFGGQPTIDEQIATSNQGLNAVSDILAQFHASATFYCTGVYAQAQPEQIRHLSKQHEIASHNHYHSSHKKADLSTSKAILEGITGKPVKGFRMPRMAPIADADLVEAGYLYNASINPTYLPGRYDYRHISRTTFTQNNLVHFPASVSPRWRIPLFWIAFHNFPLAYFFHLCKQVAQADGYVHLYFHPWEFTDYTQLPNGAKYPFYLHRNNGKQMRARFTKLMRFLQQEGFSFQTTQAFLGI